MLWPPAVRGGGDGALEVWGGVLLRSDRDHSSGAAAMTSRTIGLFALCGFLMAGVGLQAHHSLAGVYDLGHEVILVGELRKLNFTNPHSSIELTVKNKDGSTTDWTLVTASNTVLTRQGVTKSSIKPGDILKVTTLPAKNGNPLGFIKSLDLGDGKDIKLFFENQQN
jgi:Family of unknown function (DUF6152)